MATDPSPLLTRQRCHTVWTYLYQHGDATLKEIADYLGHRSTNTTEQIYVRKDNDVSKKMGKIARKDVIISAPFKIP